MFGSQCLCVFMPSSINAGQMQSLAYPNAAFQRRNHPVRPGWKREKWSKIMEDGKLGCLVSSSHYSPQSASRSGCNHVEHLLAPVRGKCQQVFLNYFCTLLECTKNKTKHSSIETSDDEFSSTSRHTTMAGIGRCRWFWSKCQRTHMQFGKEMVAIAIA